MPVTVAQLEHDVLLLPEAARAHFAHILLQSLEPAGESGVDEAWDQEARRRLEQILQGQAQGRPAEDVFGDVRARFSQAS